MASGPLTVQLRINADGSAAIVGLNRVRGALNDTGRAVSGLAASLKGLAMTAGAALSVSALASSFTSANRQAGLLRASLETVTGSVAQATTAWEVLQGFAAQTPYSLEQAVQGFIKLKSMGLDPSMAAMTSYGNTAGAMGKSLNQMIEAVADAATGEFERLKEFGIKAKQNGDEVSLTFQGVTTTIGNNAQAIEKYLLDIGNVQFAGGMERQAKTLEGSISNLGDAWDQFWVKMGDTGLTQGVITVLNDVSSGIASLGDGMTGANGVASAFGDTMTSLGAGIATTYNELKTGVWSDTTTVIMATAGAIGGAIGLMTALSAAVGIATGVWGAFTAVLLANPVTLAIAGIGALIGVMYTLRDETITIGQTTTTVGATVSAVWETTASYSQAVWQTFASYVTGEFNRLPPVVASAGNAVVSVWSATMSGLMSLTSGAVNYVMNLFRWIGQSAGVLAGEVAMSLESGFNFDRLKEGLSGAVQYTDMLGEAGQRASAGIAAAGQEIKKKAGAIAADNLEMELGSVITATHADQQRKAALAAKLHAFEQDNLAGAHGKAGAAANAGAGATKGAGAAHSAAAKAANEQEKALEALIKKYLPARDDAKNLEEATAVLDKAMKAGKLTGEEYGKMLAGLKKDYNTAEKAAQDLIDKYDTHGAKARQLAEDQAELNKIIAAGGPAAERAKVALEELGKQQVKNTDEASAWSEVWKNAVKRIDDTFAGLWKDLFSGTKSTLESMKSAITSWLAEVAHALLTKPLVVAITTAMTGGSGVAGAAGTAGTAGQAVSGLSSFSSIGSMFSTAFSLGATFLEGVGAGFSTMLSGSLTTIMEGFSFAGAGIASGTGAGMAGGIGYAMPYLAPLIIAGGLIFSKWQKDQEPRYGAFAATTGRDPRGLEKWEWGGSMTYQTGAFGLNFGQADKGSANITDENKEIYKAFADVSHALAKFYGEDVSAKIEASLKASGHILNLSEDVNEAFDIMFTTILNHGAATGDELAVVFKAVVGDLAGTAEEMANQLAAGMANALMLVQVAGQMKGTAMGDKLGLAGTDEAAAMQLVNYANAMKTSGEAIGATIQRLVLNTAVLDDALTLTGTKTTATGMDFINLANDLAKAADEAKLGMQGLAQLQGFYAKEFLGPLVAFEQQIQAAQKTIDQTFKELGGSLQIPTTRDGFMALINSLDLTTEAGRKAYVELMKLGPAFDVLFDAQEAFKAWLDPIDPMTKALAELSGVFKGWGLTLPKTKEDLLALYHSGKLSTEQMAILAAHLDALKLIFPDLADAINKAGKSVVDLTDLHIRLAEALGNERLAVIMRRQQELANAGDNASRAMLLLIYAAEDMAKAAKDAGKDPVKNFNTALLTDLARIMGQGYTNFDANNNGSINFQELADALGPLVDNKELKELMKSLDKNGDGQLSALEQLPLLIASSIGPLFDRFDADKNGLLSKDELAKALKGVVNDQQLDAIYKLLDVNGDGVVDKLEAVRLTIYTGLRDVVSGLDLSKDGKLSKDELKKGYDRPGAKFTGGIDAWLKKVYDMLDKNHDGLLTGLESLPLSLASGLEGNFKMIDTSGDNKLNLEELRKAYGKMASDDQLKALIALADQDGDGQISVAEAGNLKLDLIAMKADKLSDVIKAIHDETNILDGALKAINLSLQARSDREVSLSPPPNYIQVEAGNSEGLRSALADLQRELQDLRASQEGNAASHDRAAQSMQQATANLGAAVASLPDRIDVQVPVLSYEAGY